MFVALAIADGAISLADVLDRRIAPGSNSKLIEINKGSGEVPVMRANNDDCAISEDQILKYNPLEHQLTQLGQRAGYKQRLTPYCFRRGVGAALDSKHPPKR